MIGTETRSDKITGKQVSLLGFGTMRLPCIHTGGEIDFDTAQQMIDFAYEHGVNYYDTAYTYHKGMSEVFIGEALKKYPRESFYLADKMPPWLLKSKEDVQRVFEEQLKKCQVEYFDYYLCHNLTDEYLKPLLEYDVITYLDGEKKAGRIRHLGFSFHDTPPVMERILKLYNWDFGQIQLNYLDWEMQEAKKQYALLEAGHIPCIVMEPVRGGALAALSENSAALLKQANQGASLASWAVRYAATLPNVLTVLSGMSTPEQVQDNIATMEAFQPLTQENYAMLYRAAEMFRQEVTVHCTGCRYCMDCPAGVDIPAALKIFNAYALSKSELMFRMDYEALGAEKQAKNCVKCGQCTTHCPQGIDIPGYLAQLDALAKKLMPA